MTHKRRRRGLVCEMRSPRARIQWEEILLHENITARKQTGRKDEGERESAIIHPQLLAQHNQRWLTFDRIIHHSTHSPLQQCRSYLRKRQTQSRPHQLPILALPTRRQGTDSTMHQDITPTLYLVIADHCQGRRGRNGGSRASRKSSDGGKD